MKRTRHFQRYACGLAATLGLWLTSCIAPKNVPYDLAQLESPDQLGEASRQAYRLAQTVQEKTAKLQQSHAGMLYADKCLQRAPRDLACLYYRTLNTGIYIRNHIPNYQKGLKRMVQNCQTVIELKPDFEQAGCQRILGNIYSQAPSFSLSATGITRDLDLAVEYLREAVRLAPEAALNHLFLARVLEERGEKALAQDELQAFDQLAKDGLDRDYPPWREERDRLEKKLFKSLP